MADHQNHSNQQSPDPVEPETESAQTTEWPACPSNGLCPVVGIGASAGGLEALTQLLRALPSATGLGFVIIQHLDPHHESSLAPLLAHQTEMPVIQAVDETLVEPNHVYVIPTNTKMAIAQGRLVITPRLRENGRHLPVDFFLCSLAEDQRQCAIGVILSGTGSDGTLGLEAIKSESGITFAQDESARFDGMPRQAAAAGVVDFVMAPAGIARELEIIARHLQNGAGPTGIQNDAALQRIFSILRDHSGVDFSHYKLNTVVRRLGRRLALMHANSLTQYLGTIERHPEELAALFNDLLITVTDFFRDEQAFEALCQTAFPYILRNHQESDSIRIWVAGCASGKEVYSLAIALTEYLESNGRGCPIQIFGTDVNEQAINAARAGRFPDNIAASVSTERLRRFFVKTEGGYQIGRYIRDLCIFSRQDVTRDPPLSKMDLISCRNLLIYFRPALQRRVISIFAQALNPRGCLFLGNSETVGNLSERLRSIDSQHKIFARNLEAAPIGFENSTPTYQRSSPVSPRQEDATMVDHAADRILLDEYAPSGFLLNAAFEVVKFRGDVAPYLHPPPGDPSLNALTLVRPDISGILREALIEASQSNRIVRGQLVQVRRNDGHHEVRLIVRPMHELALDPHYLVIFEDAAQRDRREAPSPTAHTGSASSDQVVGDLTLELASTRIYMQRLIEELRSANEEAQSSNEELQSTNEELQTAKEELQSSNEELTTTNEEMQSRNTELSLLNSDLVNLLTSLEVPIIMLNGDLRIRRYTPLAAQLFKLIPTDIGRPFSDLRAALDFPDLQKTLLDVMENGQTFHGEVRTINGHWYSVYIHPYRASPKSVEGVVIQLIDIDLLKRSVEQIAHARDYSDAILATIGESLLVLDSERRVKTANQSFYKTFRSTPEETLGRPLVELGDGRWNLSELKALLDKPSEASHGRMQIEQDIPGAGRRKFELTANRIGGESRGELTLLALEDITDRLRAAEAKYRRLFEGSKDGMLILHGESGNVTDANPQALKMLNRSREDVLGMPFWDLLSMPAGEKGRSVLEHLRREEMVRLPDTELLSADGERAIVETIGSVYYEGERQVIQLNLRNISVRKQFDQQLQQSAKLESLGILAGGIAHDFNNLLTGVMGNASLALSEAPPGTHYQNSLREVIEATQRAADLTRQMLAYAGKGRFVVEPVEISELTRKITVLVRSSIPKGVTLQIQLGEDLPLVHADASQLQQVVMNLVINAAEAIPPGRRGLVRLNTGAAELDEATISRNFTREVAPRGRYVFLEVSDNGSGMSNETLEKIFDPFFTTKFTGRGLGLAAVQGIVRSHQGVLLVQTAPDIGTTFQVYLPATKAKKRRSRRPLELVSLHGQGLILVVDDEPTVARMAQATLESSGYDVLVASDGQEALQVITDRGPELTAILLDLTMPVMDAEAALPRIRELYPKLPVILSSGYDHSQVSSRLRASGFESFLQKPYTARDLLKMVKSVLSRKVH